jgi:hypothetical protein
VQSKKVLKATSKPETSVTKPLNGTALAGPTGGECTGLPARKSSSAKTSGEIPPVSLKRQGESLPFYLCLVFV